MTRAWPAVSVSTHRSVRAARLPGGVWEGNESPHGGLLWAGGGILRVKVVLVNLQGDVLPHFLLQKTTETDGGVQIVIRLLHLLDVPEHLVPLFAVHLLGPAALRVADHGRGEGEGGRVDLMGREDGG